MTLNLTPSDLIVIKEFINEHQVNAYKHFKEAQTTELQIIKKSEKDKLLIERSTKNHYEISNGY